MAGAGTDTDASPGGLVAAIAAYGLGTAVAAATRACSADDPGCDTCANGICSKRSCGGRCSACAKRKRPGACWGALERNGSSPAHSRDNLAGDDCHTYYNACGKYVRSGSYTIAASPACSVDNIAGDPYFDTCGKHTQGSTASCEVQGRASASSTW